MIAPETARSPLETCLEQLQRSAGPPPAPEALAALSARLNSTQVNLQSCGRIIERDYGLTLRLLRTANSSLFTHGDPPTFSIPHAVALVGTDSLSHLIATADAQPLCRPVSELVAISRLTAILAGSLMARQEPRFADDAAIAGLFRNIGEICFALEFPDDYADLLRRALGYVTGLRAACRTAHHFDFDEISARLLDAWGFHGAPALSALSTPEALSAQHGLPEADVALAASLGHVLATAHFRCDSAERDRLIRPFLPVLAHNYHLRERHLGELCLYAAEAFQPHLEAMRLEYDQLYLRRLQPDGALAPVHSTAADPAPAVSSTVALLRAAIAKGVDRAAWLSFTDPGVRLEAAAGEGWPDGGPARLAQLIDPRKPPFLLAFGQRQDVWIDFARDHRFLASPLAQTLQPTAFSILPVYEGRRVRGCFYFDWINAAERPPENILPALCALRDAMGSRISAA
jgi:HD-like signal output (HDOD) protein